LRRIPGTERRLAEAARLGFAEAVIPAASDSARDRMTSLRGGLRVHAVPTLQHALQALCLSRSASRGQPGRSA
jgi:DNA repair protein RadA/Sms